MAFSYYSPVARKEAGRGLKGFWISFTKYIYLDTFATEVKWACKVAI